MYEELAKQFLEIEIGKHKNKPKIFEILNEFSAGEAGVISYLTFIGEDVLSGEISKSLNISTARVAVILNSLESKGYVKRITDNVDKRKVMVRVSDEVKNHTEKKWKEAIKEIASVFKELGEKDAKEYIRLCLKIDHLINNKKNENE